MSCMEEREVEMEGWSLRGLKRSRISNVVLVK